MLDIFRDDAFGLTTLSASFIKAPYKPGRIGALALFRSRGVSTTSVIIEWKDGQLTLIQTSPRGGPASNIGSKKRKVESFIVPHLERESTVLADEVQNVRAFGSENAVEGVQQLVNERLTDLRAMHEVTLEHMRATAIQGKVLDADGSELRAIRGKEISMIFQEPMRSFGPLSTIGSQVMEAIQIHYRDVGKKEARDRTIELLQHVGIPKPELRIDGYPHQFSGGMLQRAMIAMALSCSPRLLIADEPTTAVDVTIQAQLLELLSEVQQEQGMSVMLITHNLAVVSEIADEIMVMYLGKIAEKAGTEEMFHNPLHPYTRALWRSIPKVDGELTRLTPIAGTIPSPYEVLAGCPFFARCEENIRGVCDREVPAMVEVSPGHRVSCFKY